MQLPVKGTAELLQSQRKNRAHLSCGAPPSSFVSCLKNQIALETGFIMKCTNRPSATNANERVVAVHGSIN